MKLFRIILIVCSCFIALNTHAKEISNEKIREIEAELNSKTKSAKALERIARCIPQFAKFVKNSPMSEAEFKDYCLKNFIYDAKQLDSLMNTFAKYYEYISGHYNQLGLELKYKTQLDSGNIEFLDEAFGNYDPYAHIINDMKNLGIADMIALNFPYYSLKEKNFESDAWLGKDWAYARLGEMFTVEVPAEINAEITKSQASSDNYIANYYIFMGNVINDKNEKLFPENLKLITHWNLRDELKSCYAKERGLEKQKLIFEIMQHIIRQDIPQDVINQKKYLWNPLSNLLTTNEGRPVQFTKENNIRYKYLLDNFQAMRKADKFFGNSYFERKFNSEYEMDQKAMEDLFRSFIGSEQVKQVAGLIKKKLGRNLQPFDIWYDGFKARGSINEAQLDKITKSKFKNAADFQVYLDTILTKLGFDSLKTKFLTSRITVDPSRGAGHASGTEGRTFNARLRTRIAPDGMDYKGYNIAVHEFGHNVEQTFSLHQAPHYLVRGVPNNAFTEAIAFTFQTKDLKILGLDKSDEIAQANYVLDNFWSTYEIMGVALVDQLVWKWLYANPETTPEILNDNVNRIATEVWNQYYAPVIGVRDCPILAIYSHMIDYPLYLSAYPLGHLIEFQLEEHYKGKDFAKETERVTSIGRLTPKQWMIKAVGRDIGTASLIKAADEALKKIEGK